MERLKRALSLIPIANQFPPLHGLRVLAIVSVLQVHVTVVFVRHQLLTDAVFAETSATICFGMDLFFVMSGFLIGFMLLRALEKREPGMFLRFYARRAARIMPLYYVILTALATLFPITDNQKQSLVYEYVYLTNYTRLFKEAQVMGWAWSLCVEEHFYFTVPLLLLALAAMRSHGARLLTLGLAWSSALVVRLALLYLDPTMRDPGVIFARMYLPTHTRFDTLIAGIFLAYVQYNFQAELGRLFARRSVRLASYAIAFLGFWILMSKNIFGDTYLWNVLTWGTVTSITYVALILPLINSDGIAQRILGSRPMYALATLSYGIYLLHVPICERLVVPIARSIHAPFSLVWPASLALLVLLSAAFAYVLHLLVEKPFLRLRERIAR